MVDPHTEVNISIDSAVEETERSIRSMSVHEDRLKKVTVVQRRRGAKRIDPPDVFGGRRSAGNIVSIGSLAVLARNWGSYIGL